MAKLWGVYWGIFIRHNLAFRNVWIETDSPYVHQLLSQDNSIYNAYSSLVYAINRLRDQNWNVEIKLVYPEANMCVDRLAKHGVNCQFVNIMSRPLSLFSFYFEKIKKRGVFLISRSRPQCSIMDDTYKRATNKSHWLEVN